MSDILFTREKHLGLIKLNRPQALNALTLPMILALQEQLMAWQDDTSIHAVIITAAAGKAFCAGGDVRWLYDAGLKHDAQQIQFFYHEYKLNQLIHQYSKPYIALMDGITMGGGVGISLHGSHPVASEQFVFAMPETSIGFFPDIGASYLLMRCSGQLGVYFGLTGQRANAEEAHTLGLVKYRVDSAQFPAVISSLSKMDLSQNAFINVTACLDGFSKPIIYKSIMKLRELVDDCFQHTDMESIMVALQANESDWHQETRQNLSKKSPMSLKVSLAQLNQAKGLSLPDCLKLDYCLVQHFMQSHDFYEGVRALLVDKDKAPHWQPHTLSDVTQELVAVYFEQYYLGDFTASNR